MKLFLFFTIFIVSLSSFACPNLDGKYNCDGSILTIKQTDLGNNITSFSIAENGYGEVYYSDGKEHPFEDTTRKTTCSENSVKVVFRFGIISTSEKYSMNQNGELEIFTRNVFIPSQRICKKI